MKLKRLLASVVIFALVLSMAVPAALAAPAQVDSFEEFLAADSEQLILGVDSNWYTHTADSFGSDYALSDEMIAQLIELEPMNSRKLAFLQWREDEVWGGSCYGVASSMVLNKLTKLGLSDENSELYIEKYQPGAENYFDLGKPLDNPELLDMINYYMYSQLLSWNNEYSNNLFVAELDLDGDYIADPLDEKAYEEYGLTTPEQFIAEVKAYIDNNEPFLFCYYCAAGGHAIVGLDYFEDDNDTPGNPTDDVFYLKTLDENDVTDYGDPDPAYSYLEIKKGANGKYDPLSANLYYASGENGEYEPVSGLYQISHYDINALNSYLNIENPVMPEVSFAYYPTMSIQDINQIAEDLTITVTKNGVDTDITFRKQHGFVTPVYPNHESGRLIRSFTYDFIIEGIPSASIVFENADAFTVTYTGAEPLSITMSCEETTGASGSYGSVSAVNPGRIEFDGAGQFQNMVAQSGKTMQDVSLYVGTLGNEFSTDMISIAMPGCSYVEMYDWLDHFSFDNSIVLHTDGLQAGVDLKFYDGITVIEEPLAVYSDDARDSWIKLQAQSYGETAFITLWSAFEPEDGGFPEFDPKPDMTGWIGQIPQDGWIALSSGHHVYFDAGDFYRGTLTMIANVEEHSYLLDEHGFMCTGAVPTETGYDFYNTEGTSPISDALGQLLYRAEAGEGTMKYTLTDWVPGGTAVIADDTVGTICITENDDGSYALSNELAEDIPFTVNEDGSLSLSIAGETPVEVTLVIQPNKYTITSVFSDVSTRDWFANAVKYVYSNNYMTGIEEGLFAPTIDATRGDVVQMLYNMLGGLVADPDSVPAYDDVPEDHPCYDAVFWAVGNGIADGISDTYFGVDEPITRELMAVFIYRLFGSLNLLPDSEPDPADFEDYDEVSDFARDAMDWATTYGVFEGDDYNLLRPQDVASRAECAVMAERILGYLLLVLFGLV